MNLHPESKQKKEILNQLKNLEVEAAELVDVFLSQSQCNAEIIVESIVPIDNRMPLELDVLLHKIEHRSQFVTHINLAMTYRKAEKIFLLNSASMQLNAGLTIEFIDLKNDSQPEYLVQIVDSAGIPVIVLPPDAKPTSFSHNEIAYILGNLGVHIPAFNKPSNLSEIVLATDLARYWRIDTEQTFEPEFGKQFTIKECLEGGVTDISREDIFDTDIQQAWQRSLFFCIDDSRETDIQLPASSLQLRLVSDLWNIPPEYRDITRVPLLWVPKEIRLYDGFEDVLSYDRLETETDRIDVTPSEDLIKFLRQKVLEARMSFEQL